MGELSCALYSSEGYRAVRRLLSIFLLVAALLGGYTAWWLNQALVLPSDPVDLVVQPGASARTVAQLATRRKRLEDLRLELARPFEHEGRLTDLLVRQRELHKQLDLDKDEAGSAKADAEEIRQAA